jgi:hypothetical protein
MFRLDLGAHVRIRDAILRFDLASRRPHAANDNGDMRAPARDSPSQAVYRKETNRMEQTGASDGLSA